VAAPPLRLASARSGTGGTPQRFRAGHEGGHSDGWPLAESHPVMISISAWALMILRHQQAIEMAQLAEFPRRVIRVIELGRCRVT
jgi:hypothetical protein